MFREPVPIIVHTPTPQSSMTKRSAEETTQLAWQSVFTKKAKAKASYRDHRYTKAIPERVDCTTTKIVAWYVPSLAAGTRWAS